MSVCFVVNVLPKLLGNDINTIPLLLLTRGRCKMVSDVTVQPNARETSRSSLDLIDRALKRSTC